MLHCQLGAGMQSILKKAFAASNLAIADHLAQQAERLGKVHSYQPEELADEYEAFMLTTKRVMLLDTLRAPTIHDFRPRPCCRLDLAERVTDNDWEAFEQHLTAKSRKRPRRSAPEAIGFGNSWEDR